MNANLNSFRARPLVMAVRGALLAMAMAAGGGACAADAVDPAVADLTQPVSTVEFGPGYVNHDSYKFGEYNGLQRKGAYLVGGVDLRGGCYYDCNDTTRWRLLGDNLGLDNRSLRGEYGQQGRFRVTLDYDELRRNRSDSYQTPYQDDGNGNFTLPAGWIKPVLPQNSATALNFRVLDPAAGGVSVLASGVPKAPTAAQLATGAAIRAADLPAFHNENLYTERKKYGGGLSYFINPHLELKVGAQQENKTGYKPMSTVTSQLGEYGATLADPIDQTTNQYDVQLNYTGEKSFVQAAYYVSLFSNDIRSLTWADANDPTKSATMSSAPSNQFHQFSLTGGYHFTPATQLVAVASYARSTQNDAFITAAQNNQLAWGVPTPSLNGKVVTSDLNLKLTSRPARGLNLSANYKFDHRDNQTPVNLYFFQDANESKSGASSFNSVLGMPASGLLSLGSNTNIYANRAYSKKLNQLNLDADYALNKVHAVKLGLDAQRIARDCSGAWIDCADADRTRENTVRAEWRARASDDLTGRVALAYSARRVDYNEDAFLALVPMANQVPGAPTVGATQSVYAYLTQTGLTAFGPLAGYPVPALTGNAAIFSPANGIVPQALYGSRNNINELPGMRRYNMADRNRDKVRTSLNWQASEKLSLQGSLDYNKDDYKNSVYGLQNARSWVFNLDGDLALSDNASAGLFYTYEDQRSQSAGDAYGSNSTAASVNGFTAISGGCYPTVAARNAAAKMDPCLRWSADMRDKVDTVGLTVRHKGLMGGKLDLNGDLTYTRARTDIGVAGGSYVNNPLAVAGAPAGTAAILYIPAQDQPGIGSNTTALRVSGKYSLSRVSGLRVTYLYQRLTSHDYAYTGMQYGTVGNVMPTSEVSPEYRVQVVALSYIYSFR